MIEYSLNVSNINKYKMIMEEITPCSKEFFQQNPFIRESFMCLDEYFSSFQTFDDYLLIHKLFHSWIELYKYVAKNKILKDKLELSGWMKDNIPKFENLLNDINKMSERKYKTYKNQKTDARYKITHKREKYSNSLFIGELPEEKERDIFEFDGRTGRPSRINLNKESIDLGDMVENIEEDDCDDRYFILNLYLFET